MAKVLQLDHRYGLDGQRGAVVLETEEGHPLCRTQPEQVGDARDGA